VQDESVLADLKLKLEEASAEERQARTRYNAAVDAEKPLQLLIGLQKVWEHLAEEKRQAKAELIQEKKLGAHLFLEYVVHFALASCT
jgi:NADH:ubiquinone oxidoreductase subunit 6 (subunit J)